MAKMASPDWECICNFEAILRRWVVTVLIDRQSSSAISLFDLPLATADDHIISPFR